MRRIKRIAEENCSKTYLLLCQCNVLLRNPKNPADKSISETADPWQSACMTSTSKECNYVFSSFSKSSCKSSFLAVKCQKRKWKISLRRTYGQIAVQNRKWITWIKYKLCYETRATRWAWSGAVPSRSNRSKSVFKLTTFSPFFSSFKMAKVLVAIRVERASFVTKENNRCTCAEFRAIIFHGSHLYSALLFLTPCVREKIRHLCYRTFYLGHQPNFETIVN